MSDLLGNHAAGLQDYAEIAGKFRVAEIAGRFHGDLAGGLNACVECCDRHADGGGVALTWEGVDGRRASYDFATLQALSAQFAGVLAGQGVQPGDVVASLLPRTPALLVTILGIWRMGGVYQPLFTAFGPQAIGYRLAASRAKLVVTDPANRAKLDEVADVASVAMVVGPGEAVRDGDIDFHAAVAGQSVAFAPVMRRGDDPFLMMSTSGTTGRPKSLLVPLKALFALYVYMRDAIDLRAEDRFWNIADPGWAYGLYYAFIGPLLLGRTTNFYEGGFTVASTYRIIAERGITNLAGSPTAFRLLIAAGPEAARAVRGRLRVASSAGEPLNPEVIRWFAEHLGVVVHDHYGQTELGMVVNNHHRLRHAVHAGSAGFAMPGFRVAVLDEAGKELGPHQQGMLAVDIARSPLMWFGGYAQQATPAMAGGYYRTGDTVELEPDGRISFVGRADDVITSSGYRIGPFDVESALIAHDAVVEAAVIGKPDPQRTEIVKAFVVLKSGWEASEALAAELQALVKHRLSAHAYPREVAFVEQLPKTPSGKLQRFVLRNEERAKAAGG